MAIQFGTVDGLVNISNDTILCFVKGIDEFISQGGPAYARNSGISYGTAFQRFIEPVYVDRAKSYTLESIKQPVLTRSGSEQSPARGTFCKKMGLLKMDESNEIFEITPIGKAILEKNISIEEYSFILLSKMGVFKNGEYVDNLLNSISIYFQSHAIVSQNSLEKYIKLTYSDDDIVKTRLDILINSLVVTGLLTKVTNDIYVLSGTTEAVLFIDYNKHSNKLSNAIIDNSKEYSDYIGNLEYGGILDILNGDNFGIYIKLFPNLFRYMKSDNGAKSLQQIFFCAPGTGKSKTIKDKTDEAEKHGRVFRTTFHPDSDYSTFVGCYKPTMKVIPKTTLIGTKVVEVENGTPDEKIVYQFTPQAFTNAYVKAWNTEEDVYLLIEEINRGNCAQIFGDLFQLLDRGADGRSEYPIDADSDLANYIAKELAGSPRTDFPNGVNDGTKLMLPENLYIWATMNTSDQSLFPIDSAFKRRWDWKYLPIENAGKKWKIKVNNNEYDWYSFLEAINKEVFDLTHSEDKQLGYFFAKAKDGFIDAETLVNKVYFYLWTDVFKDYDYESQKAFRKPSSNEPIAFKDFFKSQKVDETMAEQVLVNLGLGKPQEIAE